MAWNKCKDVTAAAKTQWRSEEPPFLSYLIKISEQNGDYHRCTHLFRALRQRVPQRTPASDDDRGLVVVPARILVVRRPGGPAGSRAQIVAVGRGGILPPHRHGHGDDEREEAIFSGPLGAHTLRVGGTPGPVGLLKQVKATICKCSGRLTLKWRSRTSQSGPTRSHCHFQVSRQSHFTPKNPKYSNQAGKK